MPITSVTRPVPLANPGDQMTVNLVAAGVAYGTYAFTLIGLTGTFTGAVISVSGIPTQAPFTPIPLTVLQVNGPPSPPPYGPGGNGTTSLPAGPIGPLTTVPQVEPGFLFIVLSGLYRSLQVQLISIGSGSITTTVSTVTYP